MEWTDDAILAALAVPAAFPRQALEAARRRRETLAPRLIAEIDGWRESRPRDGAFFFGLFLLAEWRETGATPAICRMLAGDAAAVDAALGDMITEALPAVLVSVFDGDADPLFALVDDPQVASFVRSTVLEAILALVLMDRVPRETLVGWLDRADGGLIAAKHEPIWFEWAQATATLGLADFAPRVKAAYGDGRIDPQIQTLGHFEEDLAAELAGHGRMAAMALKRCRPIDNTVATLETWHFARIAEGRVPKPRAIQAPQPAAIKVGRNDPCPCGSGKKFKKCCLGKALPAFEAM